MSAERSRWPGLYPAIVDDIVDPKRLGRVRVSFPGFGADGQEAKAWARLLTPYADDDQGLEIVPSVGSEVVVAFEAGDPSRPYVVGAAWNGQAAQPEAPEAANNLRTLKTRSGSLLQFDDTTGAAKVTLSMQSGHKVVLDDAAQEVTVAHANGSTVVIDAAGTVRITANATVDVTAAAVNIHAPTVMCDGLVQCQTLIATTVTAATYSPGAGNIW